MKPLPNRLFTRDTSCWIYNGVSINPMAKPARQRETNNLRAIYRWHPAFADGEFIKYFGDENINYDHATLEGGDVLVIGRGAVLIGMSERTTPQGVEFLANSLFKHRQAERVIAVELPKHRSCMHLDTVMTHIDVDTFSVYPEVVRRTPSAGRSPRTDAAACCAPRKPTCCTPSRKPSALTTSA